MKKVFVLLLVSLMTITSFAQAEDKGNVSKSKAVQFMERDGSLLKKEYYNLGTVKGIECEVVITTDLKNNEKIGCLKLKTTSLGFYYVGYLDADELAAAIQSLEYIKDVVLSSKPTTHTEVLYKSRDNVVMGTYTVANSFDNSYKWRVFVKPNDYKGSFEDFNQKHIETFIEYMKKSESIIAENTK